MLVFENTVRSELEAFVTAGYPHETCGVMIGLSEGGKHRVLEVVQAGNLNTERAHDRYQLNPDDFNRADREARAKGLDVIGIWHSHPDHPAKPSQEDLDKAWEGWSYVIVSVTQEGVADCRSWRLPDPDAGKERRFYEEPLEPGDQ